MEVAYREQARRVRGAVNRIPQAFSLQFYNSANQLVAAEIEYSPAGRETEREKRILHEYILFPFLHWLHTAAQHTCSALTTQCAHTHTRTQTKAHF